MCGRYVQARAGADLVADLDAQIAEGVEVRQSWNVAPTTRVPVLLESLDDQGELHREIHSARWGLLPGWAKDDKLSYKTFNARSETVAEKPTFRSAARARRCAVPATAYYEWFTEGKVKTPHAVRPKDDSGILFAGLYEWHRDYGLSTTILTGPAPSHSQHEDLAWLHDRLPLALSAEAAEDWLRPEKLEKQDTMELVDYVRSQAYVVAAGWEVYPVSRDVGNVRNNSPELLEQA